MLLLLASAPAQAQTTISASVEAAATGTAVIPFDLVSLAYQGFLEEQGVSRFNGLIFGYRIEKITAEDLMQAAIDGQGLSLDTINNRSYLAAVERQLESLFINSNKQTNSSGYSPQNVAYPAYGMNESRFLFLF